MNKPASPAAKKRAPRSGPDDWSKDIKAYYDQAAKEPVPEAFSRLMNDLAKSIRK